jgi:hypothetical protein
MTGQGRQPDRETDYQWRRAMPSREDVEAAQALYEAAKADFELLKQTIAEAIRSGRNPTSEALTEEDNLRAKLFVAAAKLSTRHRRRAIERSA